VKCSLSGSAAPNYTTLSEQILTGGEIIRKQLTISKTTVVTTKVEDGNVTAEISALGKLQGVVTIDENGVGVKALASYNNTSVGTDKTIKITYILTGDAKDNYFAPADSVITNAVISSNKLSADYIVKIYNDVVSCDNRKNHFVSYQWYKNGVLIAGATDQFYCDKASLNGAYSVRVITTDGEVIFSDEKVFTSSVSVKKVSTYPNPVKSNQSFTVAADGFETKELENATLSVYTLQGICVYQSTNVRNMNTVNLSLAPQMYIGRIKVKDGSEHMFKVIVEK